MKRILLLSSLILCSFSLLFSQSPTLSLSALCSDDGGDYAITSSGGKAYIYQRGNSQWTLNQTLQASDGTPLNGPLGFRAGLFTDPSSTVNILDFGRSVKLKGDLAYVAFSISGFNFNNLGAFFDVVQTYVYKRQGQSWTLVEQLLGGDQIEVEGQNVFLLSAEGISFGFPITDYQAIMYTLSPQGTSTASQTLLSYNFDSQFAGFFIRPSISIHLSPDEDLAVTAFSGDPVSVPQDRSIRIYGKSGNTWAQETSFSPVTNPVIQFAFPFDVAYVENHRLFLDNGDVYEEVSPGTWTLRTTALPSATLVLDDSKAFLAQLTFPSNTDEDEFILYRRIGGGSFQPITTLCGNTQTYTDSVMVFGQNVDYYFEATYASSGLTVTSNTVTYSLPAIIQPLDVNYVCYDPASDSLTWSVFNPNMKDHPFIYAQWWNAQRDTLYAQAGGTVTFKTKNNPQNPGTFGDDNITGIWWIDQTLTPGQPNDIVFNIPLSQSCAGLRMANTSPAQKAGSIFEGTLGNYLKVNVEAQDLLTGQVQIAPNPVSERLTIRGLQLEGEGNVQITNTLGQVIFEQSVELQKEISLNLQALPVGTYIMTLKTPVGNVSEKILKE
ncbi:MAG: T9SS type A sorting domain-containing protein [Bacteroidota bacterium]